MKDKEEFSRKDPNKIKKTRALVFFNYIVPIIIVLIGIFITTQKFAYFMSYNTNVVGHPLFSFPNGYTVYNPLVFLLGIFKFCFNDYYSYYLLQAIPPCIICLVLALIIFLITGFIAGSHQKNQHIHGTTRWANVKDLEKAGLLCKEGVVCGELSDAQVTYKVDSEKQNMTLDLRKDILGRVHTSRLICHSGRTNTWLIAPTRSGKGVSSIIPTQLSLGVPYYDMVYNKDSFFYTHFKGAFKRFCGHKEIKGKYSIVVFDPKGENWEITAGFRSLFSTCIPFRPLDANGNTAHYNPMLEIPDSASEAFAWADMIAEIFFGAENAKSAGDGATQYFNNTARDIFAGVVLHVRFNKDIKREEKNLSTVLNIFSQTSDDDENSKKQQGEDGNCGQKMLNQMRQDGIHVHDDGSPFPEIHNLIVKAANRSETQTPKERASTYSTVFSKISLFQDPLLAGATSKSDFSVDDFVNSKNSISLYLIVPYNHIKRIAPVFRMIITFMIKKFSSGTTNANDVKLKIPCMFLLDEFPVLGYFPDIALNAGILAGYGVTFFIVSQSVNQIVDVYGENHPFFDHCKTIISFANGNQKDAALFSQMVGNRSVLLDNVSSSGSKFKIGYQNMSLSSQETSVSLVNPDELMKLEFNRLIVFQQGNPPYKGKKVVYYKDPRFKDIQFMKIDEKLIFNRIKKLPSNQRQKILTKTEEKIKAIDAEAKVQVEETKSFLMRYLPSSYNFFDDVPMEENGNETA